MIDFTEDKVAEFYCQIDNLFLKMGLFKKVVINDRVNYVYKNHFYRIDYYSTLGFIIQYTDSFSKANRNIYEDSVPYPISLGSKLIETIQQDIQEVI